MSQQQAAWMSYATDTDTQIHTQREREGSGFMERVAHTFKTIPSTSHIEKYILKGYSTPK